MKSLEGPVHGQKRIENNRLLLDERLQTLSTRIAHFLPKGTQAADSSSADRLRAFYDDWEQPTSTVCREIDGELECVLQKLRACVEAVQRQHVEIEKDQQDDGLDDDQPSSDELSESVGPARGDEPPSIDGTPNSRTPQGDSTPESLTELIEELRCLAHKRLDEQLRAASIEVLRIVNDRDDLFKRHSTDARRRKRSCRGCRPSGQRCEGCGDEDYGESPPGHRRRCGRSEAGSALAEKVSNVRVGCG